MSATLLPPGTEEPITEGDPQGELHTGSVSIGGSSSKDRVTDAPADMTVLMMDEARISPMTPPRLADIDRRGTLMPARSITPNRIGRKNQGSG